MESTVRSAARRQIAAVVIEQSAFALAPVLGGTVLLLLLGTQILDWYWIALLGLAGLALAAIRIRGGIVSPYETAQILDRHFHLEDSISTAWFLLEHGEAGHTATTEFQLSQAEEMAAKVQASSAFPVSFGRAWALTGALAAIAFGLFSVRYLVARNLTFEQSLIPIQITPVFERLEAEAKLFAPNKTPGNPGGQDRVQANSDKSYAQPSSPEEPQTRELQGDQPGTPTDPNGNARSMSQADAGKPGDPQSRDGQAHEPQSGSSQPDEKQSDQPTASEKTAQSETQQPNGGQQGAQGLMDKMRDALSSLMTKFRQDSTQQGQQSDRPSDEENASSKNSGKAQQGQQQDARNQQSGQDPTSDSQAQAQATERTQASQGRSSDSSPQKGSDARSGIGRQDGDKALKEAEQLQAMGKLAEIIGKRSASLTGDMTIETPSGKQQLKTAYSQKLGHHSDSGGEINRDEVPLEDQEYVRTYMEMIRKQGKTNR